MLYQITDAPSNIEKWWQTGRKLGYDRMVWMIDKGDGSFYPTFLHAGQALPVEPTDGSMADWPTDVYDLKHPTFVGSCTGPAYSKAGTVCALPPEVANTSAKGKGRGATTKGWVTLSTGNHVFIQDAGQAQRYQQTINELKQKRDSLYEKTYGISSSDPHLVIPTNMTEEEYKSSVAAHAAAAAELDDVEGNAKYDSAEFDMSRSPFSEGEINAIKSYTSNRYKLMNRITRDQPEQQQFSDRERAAATRDIAALDSAVAKSSLPDMTVYRGISPSVVGGPNRDMFTAYATQPVVVPYSENDLGALGNTTMMTIPAHGGYPTGSPDFMGLEYASAKYDWNEAVGKTIQDTGFVSTSVDPSVARSFAPALQGGAVARVTIPAGTHGIEIPEEYRVSNHQEQEVLLGRNMKFLITGFHPNGVDESWLKNHQVVDMTVVP